MMEQQVYILIRTDFPAFGEQFDNQEAADKRMWELNENPFWQNKLEIRRIQLDHPDTAVPSTDLYKCKAQPTADPPQDCDWPVCGCDPYADKVIEALQESGKLPAAPSTDLLGERITDVPCPENERNATTAGESGIRPAGNTADPLLAELEAG
jgi:hypothetical protein